jgi:hypothetical protein
MQIFIYANGHHFASRNDKDTFLGSRLIYFKKNIKHTSKNKNRKQNTSFEPILFYTILKIQFHHCSSGIAK